MVIGIDHGFGMIKTRNTAFKAGLDITSSAPPIAGSEYIEWDGKFYTQSGTRQPLRKSKVQDDSYYVLTMMGIAKEVKARHHKDTRFPVTIAAGLPLADFSNQVDAFREYLVRDGRMKFSYNGEEFDVTVDGAEIYPQGYSAVVTQMGQLRQEPVVHVIDIGSWTTDTVTLKEGNPDGNSQHSYEIGVIKAIDWIAERVKQTCGRLYSSEQIENVLWDKQVSLPQAVKEAIKEHARGWAQRFIRVLQEGGFDTATAVTWFIGGGAHLINSYYRDEHRDEMQDTHFITDLAANAVGYESEAAL